MQRSSRLGADMAGRMPSEPLPCSLCFLFYFKMYLFERRKRERKGSSIPCLVLQIAAVAGGGSEQSQELPWYLPRGWQEPQDLLSSSWIERKRPKATPVRGASVMDSSVMCCATWLQPSVLFPHSAGLRSVRMGVTVSFWSC